MVFVNQLYGVKITNESFCKTTRNSLDSIVHSSQLVPQVFCISNSCNFLMSGLFTIIFSSKRELLCSSQFQGKQCKSIKMKQTKVKTHIPLNAPSKLSRVGIKSPVGKKINKKGFILYCRCIQSQFY